MSTMTRRAILRGSTVAAAAMAVSAVPAIALADTGDAVLLRMIDNYNAVMSRWHAAIDAATEAEEAADEKSPERPAILMGKFTRYKGGESVTTIEPLSREYIEDFGGKPKADRLAALAAYEAECAAVLDAHGIPQLYQIAERLEAEGNATMMKILTHPAVTIAGVVAKLRIADYYGSFTEDAAKPAINYVAPRMMASVIRDAERLAGGSA
jgi:hypothetical protein